MSLVGSLLAFNGTSVAQAAPGDPVLAPGTPTISGTARVGRTLTAKPGDWKPAPVTFTYQWYRSGVAITGATKSSYVLVAADKGRTVTVTVVGARDGYDSAAKSSKATRKVAAGTLITATPKISGTAKVGRTLTLTSGTWKPAPVKLAYQWYRSGKKIKKATRSTYTLVSADKGKKITVTVTGTKAGYDKASKTSKKTGKVGSGSLTTAKPTITGEAVVGKKLTAKRGTWQPSGVKFSYQWYRSGKKIKKATRSTYTLVSADKGKKITVRVTGKKNGYRTTSRTSAATPAVLLPISGATPTIDGYPYVRTILTAKPGRWTPSGVKLSYRWYANGTAIAGATGSSFVITGAQVGKRITVAVTGKRSGYASLTRTSKATAVVTDGVYLVGEDLKPGTYIAKGGAECVWARLTSLDLDDIGSGAAVLGSGPIHNGQTIVTVDAFDPYFLTMDCGQWATMSTKPALRASVSDGDYAVGVHVEPGLWASTGITSECYVQFAAGFGGTTGEIIEEDTPSPGTLIEILSTDVRFTSVDCGTWVRQGAAPASGTAIQRQNQKTLNRADSRLDKSTTRLNEDAERLAEAIPDLLTTR